MRLVKIDHSIGSVTTLKLAYPSELLLLVQGRSPWYQILSLIQAVSPQPSRRLVYIVEISPALSFVQFSSLKIFSWGPSPYLALIMHDVEITTPLHRSPVSFSHVW